MKRVDFEGSEQYVFPKFLEDYNDFKVFPPATVCDEDDDGDGDEIAHPLVQVLRDGAVIADVLIEEEFEDDSCDCASLTITLENGDKYGISMWWLSSDGMYTIMGAERNKQEDLQALTDWIKG